MVILQYILKLKNEIEKNNKFLIEIEPNNNISNSKDKNFYKFNIFLNNNKYKEKNQSKISNKKSYIDLSSYFKTIDNILEEYYDTKIEDSNIKVLTLVQNMEKDLKDYEKYYNDILAKIYNVNFKNKQLISKFGNEYNKI